MSKDIEPVITGIRARRAIYYLDGYVKNKGDGQCDLGLYNFDTKELTLPTEIIWDKDTFHIYLNVESANNDYPLETGNYYLAVLDAAGCPHMSSIDDAVREKREQEEWQEEIRIYKNKGHHIICTSMADLDTDDFLINVVTALPQPRRNYIVKRFLEWRRGVGGDIKEFSQRAFTCTFNLLNKVCRKKGNKVLFTSGSRVELGGNEEFIYRKMVELGLDKQYKIVFDFKKSIQKVYGPFRMLRFIYRLASSDIILLDDYYPEFNRLVFSENVKVVQVWHACGAFKALGLERMNKKGAPSINTTVHKCYTHVFVSSKHSAYHHQEAFGIGMDKFYPIGVPRTDIFFDEEYKEKICNSLYELYPRAKTADQVIMYAPTFRGENAFNATFPMEKFDLQKWGEMCQRTNSYLIVKMHPFVQEKIEIPPEFADYIVDASEYREVNDLLFIVDVLVTDYSSIIYEFSLLRRPMLFYAFDQNMYVSTRDFYEDYEDIVPGRIVKRFDVLLDLLEKKEYDIGRLEWFIDKNFTYTDGKASERAVKLIFEK